MQTMKIDFTEREEQICKCVMDGDSIDEIAAKVFVSPATVKTHLRHIYLKTKCRDRYKLIAFLHRNKQDD